MKKSMKKVTSLMMATAMTAGLLAGCGGGSESADTSGSGAAASGGGDVQISLLNSKGEIQTALEEMAEAYGEATGVELEIIACGSGESPYTRITSMYNSGTAPTMAILDTTDVIALGEEYAVDLRLTIRFSASRSVSRDAASFTTRLPSRRPSEKSGIRTA